MIRFAGVAAAAVLTVGFWCGLASAAVWEPLVPKACIDTRSLVEQEPDLLGTRTFGSVAELHAAADAAARAQGVTLRDAQWRVARTAVASVAAPGDVAPVLDFLRSLWRGGEARAALAYGELAARWPALPAVPSADRALASAAVAGSAEAMLALARHRASGAGAGAASVPALLAQARSLLWGRVTGGECGALTTLARLHLYPVDGERDPAQAEELLAAAAERHVAAAAVALADLLLSGDGVAYDLDRAIALLERESGRGTRGAQSMLLRLRLAGPLPARDRARADRIAAAFAASHGPDSMGVTILLAEDAAGRFGGPIDRGRVATLLAEAERHPPSLDHAMLARAYLEGWQGTVDIPAATRALTRAVSQGSAEAQAALAELRLMTEGVVPEAVRMLQEAAERGVIGAMLRLQGLAAARSVSPKVADRMRALLVEAAGTGSDAAASAVARTMFREAILDGELADDARTALEQAARNGSVVAAMELERARNLFRNGRERAAPDAHRAAGLDDYGAPERMLRIGRAYNGQTALGTHPDIASDWFAKCARLGDIRCHAALAGLSDRHPDLNLMPAAVAERSRRIAAEAGIADAIFAVGTMTGPPSGERVRRAAELNHLPAMLALLDASRGDAARLRDGVRWFDRASALAQADIEQSVALGRAYRDGSSLPKDADLALAIFTRAATLGSGVAMREVADLQLAKPETEARAAGLQWLQRAAALGDVPAIERLSRAHFDGWFGRADATAGFRFALLAAARGSAESKHLVADALETGFGTRADPAEAERWRRDAAAGGDVAAMVTLGERALADASQKDGDAALAWFGRAAAAGDGRALYRLGRLQQEGRFGPPDEAAAQGLFEAAAERGNLMSIYTLSRLRDQTHPAPAERRRMHGSN